MRYSEIIIYRRNADGKTLNAYRQSIAPNFGAVTVRAIPFAPIFKGHCDWIARDIAARKEREAERAARASREASRRAA